MSSLRAPRVAKSSASHLFQHRISSVAPTQYSRFYAHQSYGGGEGDPKAENPQDQGSNPSANKEHPGPPPPSAGQGTGGGPTKAGDGGHNIEQNESSGGSGGSQPAKAGKGAQPKIHSEGMPSEESADVKKHNEELENRHDRAANKVDTDGKDNVSKGFWSGPGGAGR